MIKVESITGGPVVKMKVSDYRSPKAAAYHAGEMGHEYRFEFLFEREMWLKGEADDHRIREEIARGDR